MDKLIIYLICINILGAVLDGVTAARRRRTSHKALSVLVGIIAIAGGDRTASKTNMMLRVFTVCVCVIELAVFMTWKLRPVGKWSFAFWDVFVEYRWTLWFVAAVSVVTFVMFGIDKYSAVKGGYRIPIAVLLGMAFAGGSIGALLGMVVFRHKIRKNYFSVGVPLILVMQVVLLMCVVNLL